MITYAKALFVFLILSLILETGQGQISPQIYRSGPEEKDFHAYLFTYFTSGSAGEAIRFGVSTNGYTYKALNHNEPVLDSKRISSTGGVRDPHIYRKVDGSGFYMVATDMTAAKGWDSNRAMVLLQSTDLVQWTSSVVNIQHKFANQDSLKRVWAPQTIFDAEKGKYLIYWSMKHANGPDIIYYSYANEDFTDLTDEPKILFRPRNGGSCIDGDIIFKAGIYYLFYKTEGDGNGIKVAESSTLTSGTWLDQPGYKQQTSQAVEGSTIFKLINEDKYILSYDVYRDKSYQFCESTDLLHFTPIDSAIQLDFKPRHGSIVPITQKELATLLAKWGTPEGFQSTSNQNPIIEGYYADPEVLYAEKTKKYYIYPTSDGFHEWSGHYFKAFSSSDLKNWKDEGVILDLKKDVPWADRNAWAPTIIEHKKEGKYKYYYYYTAAQKIGVAVSDHPTGPFLDSGKPLIDFKPEGINRGQEIDPDVFKDPTTGKYYLYWGNGYLAVAELEDDMISIKKSSLKVITPPSTFREGAEVFFRNDRYYFLWSENDTRSEDYRVRYAYSHSPTGPLTIPEDNLILRKDPSLGIYGTGHNSVLKISNKDEWYMVYHRFSRPNGINMGRAAGYHREVCMDPISFNEDGTIKILAPSR